MEIYYLESNFLTNIEISIQSNAIEKRLQIKTKYYQKVTRDKNWFLKFFFANIEVFR